MLSGDRFIFRKNSYLLCFWTSFWVLRTVERYNCKSIFIFYCLISTILKKDSACAHMPSQSCPVQRCSVVPIKCINVRAMLNQKLAHIIMTVHSCLMQWSTPTQFTSSSKELGFFNPRSQLNSLSVVSQ